MENKQEIIDFVQKINLLFKYTQLLNIDNHIYYIYRSPFIYNRIEWNKEKKDILLKILYKKFGITFNDFKNNRIFSTRIKFDMNIYININKVIPEYKSDFVFWLNSMYYSSINLEYIVKTWCTCDIFKDNFHLLNINVLNIENIIISLDLLFLEWKKIIETNNIWLTWLIKNNLLLMLISDYKDILLNIRWKDYNFDINEINNNMYYIENKINVSRSSLFNLDFSNLIEDNYKKSKINILIRGN